MTKQIIHIYGAAGSGTSTLGKYISEKLGYFWMDTDDYFWLPDPPYTIKRPASDRLALMKQDISKWDNVVISGSLVDWGDELIPLFTLAIRIETKTNIRIERLKKEKESVSVVVLMLAAICTKITENLLSGRLLTILEIWV